MDGVRVSVFASVRRRCRLTIRESSTCTSFAMGEESTSTPIVFSGSWYE